MIEQLKAALQNRSYITVDVFTMVEVRRISDAFPEHIVLFRLYNNNFYRVEIRKVEKRYMQ